MLHALKAGYKKLQLVYKEHVRTFIKFEKYIEGEKFLKFCLVHSVNISLSLKRCVTWFLNENDNLDFSELSINCG